MARLCWSWGVFEMTACLQDMVALHRGALKLIVPSPCGACLSYKVLVSGARFVPLLCGACVSIKVLPSSILIDDLRTAKTAAYPHVCTGGVFV